MKKLIIASRNPGKIREFKNMLTKFGFSFTSLEEWPDLPEPEETGKTFMENACLKASYYAKATNSLCLADDSGLEVMALDGAPGVFSARYAGEHANDKENNELLLKNMQDEKNRRCRFFCALALADPDGSIKLSAEGACEGELLYSEKGSGGFGYDPLFFSQKLKKTLAEATPDEKNSLSHRSRALKELVQLMGEHYADRDNG